MNKNNRVAFFGLGAIGYGMATNLLKGGYSVNIVRHRNQSTIAALVQLGATEFDSKCEAVQTSDVVLLCLPNSKVVNLVIDEINSELKEGHLVIDAGTSSLQETARLAARLASQGISFAESPLSGGKAQADAGEMGAYVGASEESFAKVKPVLEQFCLMVHRFGDIGAGGKAKLIGNYLALSLTQIIIDTFRAADALNIDWDAFYEIVCLGAANSRALHRIVGNIVENDDYKGYMFSVKNAQKDMAYIEQLSKDSGLESVLNREALNFYENATGKGFGDLMVSELLREDVIRILSGPDQSSKT